jgi:ubiquitin carboxyl-terminal hydrolase 8
LKSSALPDVNGTFSGLSSQKSRAAIPHSNTAFPKDLHRYLKEYNVLVIDVRNRADFDRERIRAEAIICMEPQLLTRSR